MARCVSVFKGGLHAQHLVQAGLCGGAVGVVGHHQPGSDLGAQAFAAGDQLYASGQPLLTVCGMRPAIPS